MNFPHYFHLFGLSLHPHLVLEATAYAVGFALHHFIRKALPGPKIPPIAHLWIIAGLVLGALAGAHMVAFFDASESASAVAAFMGKSIVGALAGGWIGVEIAKRLNRVRGSTGDAWVIPLLASIAVGRVGCFLTGLSDHTYGVFTTLPWAVDFGDGPRHPTQLYESFFCLGMIPIFSLLIALLPKRPGLLFRLFIIVYMLFRFVIEFIKPTPKPLAGISVLQAVCLATAAYALFEILFRLSPATTASTTIRPAANLGASHA
jgi:prolipoprotein diacylglyceryltransferase